MQRGCSVGSPQVLQVWWPLVSQVRRPRRSQCCCSEVMPATVHGSFKPAGCSKIKMPATTPSSPTADLPPAVAQFSSRGSSSLVTARSRAPAVVAGPRDKATATKTACHGLQSSLLRHGSGVPWSVLEASPVSVLRGFQCTHPHSPLDVRRHRDVLSVLCPVLCCFLYCAPHDFSFPLVCPYLFLPVSCPRLVWLLMYSYPAVFY